MKLTENIFGSVPAFDDFAVLSDKPDSAEYAAEYTHVFSAL